MKPTYKNFCQLELKELNKASGIVTFYYSEFNSKDQNGDIVLDSAFKKTVAERKEHIYHNIQHSEFRVVGNPISFDQDKKGAFCTSQLALDQEDGHDAFLKYEAKMIKGHSIEFKTINSTLDQKLKARVVSEVLLWGVTSITTIPANYGTQTISIKGITDLVEEMKKINEFLHTADVSEKCGNEFLMEYKKMEDNLYSALKTANITTCKKCMSIMDKSMNGKCANCGQFVNKAKDNGGIDYAGILSMINK